MHNDSLPNRRTLLVVEDDLDLAELSQTWLQARGLIVDLAHDGQQALAQLQSKPNYTAVICDLRMPVVDGVSLLRWMCAHRPQVPRIVMSSYAGPILDEQGHEIELHARFYKPLSRDDRRRMLALLEQLPTDLA